MKIHSLKQAKFSFKFCLKLPCRKNETLSTTASPRRLILDTTWIALRMTLVGTITEEVLHKTESELHPKVSALVSAFVAYLKEPRYQNPLTISELASLFGAFYQDLYGLIFNIYAQLTLCKRQLIQNSPLFAKDLKTYDYLNAIAHYSSSHTKLLKRSDPQAAYQLRVFAFYKAATIIRTCEMAQSQLFSSVTPGDHTELYYKIFRFDLRDLSIQDLLNEKLAILRKLSLPLSAFCETGFKSDSASLDEYFMSLSGEASQTLDDIKSQIIALDKAKMADSKLKYIVKIQKSLIDLCSGYYQNDSSKVNNDLLLPALIYIIIYHPPEVPEGLSEVELYLNFTFVKNFSQILDPYNITASSFNLNSSLSNYTPTERRETLIRNEKIQNLNFFELINLKESNSSTLEDAEVDFRSDTALINYLQKAYFNTGELQYYLTNFEAILFFLVNTPIKDIVPDDYTIPEAFLGKDVVTLPLHQVLEAREKKDVATMKGNNDDTKVLDDQEEESNVTPRSRSSSLFNTISSAVTQTVNRSRSNSAALKAQHKEASSQGFEASLTSTLHNGDNYGLTPVRKFFGRIGQASGVNLSEHESASTNDGEESIETRSKRSLSLFDVFSPGLPRTRSGSGDNPPFMHTSNLRKPTITTKLLNGVSELMTKLNVAANASGHTLSLYGEGNSHLKTPSREDSLEDCSLVQKPAPLMSDRASSVEKWFNNLGESGDAQTCSNSQMDSAYNEGSLFSASFEELTKYHHVDFETLTMKDLKIMKNYYDQLCNELLALKSDLKTSQEYLPEEMNKEQGSI